MKRIIEFYVRYPIWTNVIMLAIVGYGLLSLKELRYSFFPETRPDIINVQVPYPGASPEEVAEGVVLKIEEALDGLDGVERVTSISSENSGSITVELRKDTDLDGAVADVKNAIDRISSFPVGAEKPVIFEQEFRTRAISLALAGETDLYNLKYIAETIRDDLLATSEISQVAIEGLPDLEFSIEVAESKLRQYEMSIDEITSAVAKSNVNISGGKFETAEEEVLIRAWGRDYFARELQDLPIRGNTDGTVIFLKDVATVKEQWEDTPSKRFFNGETAVILTIDQTAEEDIIAIAERAREYMDEFNATNDKVQLVVLDDRTIPLRQRVELLVKNGLIGLLLVVITLGFFLNLRLSFWVAIAIPFSFAGMFIVANFVGITLNVISLFGMIIVVGILVDDAIVVGENVYAEYEKGAPALKAAINGTMQVIGPVTTSVLTTVLAFTPFFFLDGNLGKFIWQMALVVVASLLFSLLEAFFLLPSHLAHSKGLHLHREDPPLRQKIERIIGYLTNRLYAPTLRLALKYKWIVIVTPVAMVLFTIGLIGGGVVGVTFFPFIDSDTVPVSVSLVAGRQEADTDAVLKRIEKAAWEVNEELKSERLDGRDVILNISRELGSNDLRESGSHAGRLTMYLLDGEIRDLPSFTVANRVRDKVGPLPEAQNAVFGNVSRFGKPVSVSLLGNDIEQMTRARELLKAELEDFSTLKDITDSDQEGRRELSIELKPKAHALGLTVRDIAGQVRQGFFGQEVQRIQRGRDEIRVWVRYPIEDRSALGYIDQMRIRVPDGREVPFAELATYTIGRGITSINHLDRKREIKVEANLADVEGDLPPILEEIRTDVLPRVMAQVRGVTASFEGQSRDQAKIQASMKKAFPLAILGMLVLVTLVFRSYLQSMLIFSLIPIGILGAIWGHGLHGLQVNMLSLFGIIALSGIIINDSIVFVDQINRNLRDGQKVFDAVYNSGLSRLRPILLTTLTTSLGLAPLILETSRQAQFLIPMAISVAYGLLFGTFILLIILPAGFLVFNSIRVKAAELMGRIQPTPESVEPAVKELQVEAAE